MFNGIYWHRPARSPSAFTHCTLCIVSTVKCAVRSVHCTIDCFHCLFRSPWTALQCIGNGVIPQKKMRSKKQFPNTRSPVYSTVRSVQYQLYKLVQYCTVQCSAVQYTKVLQQSCTEQFSKPCSVHFYSIYSEVKTVFYSAVQKPYNGCVGE